MTPAQLKTVKRAAEEATRQRKRLEIALDRAISLETMLRATIPFKLERKKEGKS